MVLPQPDEEGSSADGRTETTATEPDVPRFLTDEDEQRMLNQADLKEYNEWNDKRDSHRADLEK